MTEQLSLESKVPTRTKLLYGIGTLGEAITQGIFTASYIKFYQDILGLEAGWITICLLIYAVWNAINDPIFGTLTDNTRTKVGRRVPYLRYLGPVYGISFMLVWFPPLSSQLALFGWMLFSIAFYDTMFTLMAICRLSLMPEMTLDEKERSNVSFVSMIFAMAGLIFSFIVPAMFLTGSVESIEGDTQAFQVFCVAMGFASMATYMILGFGIKERTEFSREEPVGFIEGLKRSFSNKNFLVFEANNFAMVLVFNIVVTVVFYFTEYNLNLGGLLSYLPVLVIFSTIIIGYFLLARYYLPRKGIHASFTLGQSILFVGFLAILLPGWFSIIGMVLVGLGLVAPLVFNDPMLANIIDEDELKYGKRREGMFFGTQAFVTKWAISIAGIIIVNVLDVFGFIPKKDLAPGDTQPASALLGITLLMSIIPSSFVLVAFLILRTYKLKGERLLAIKKALEEAHLATSDGEKDS